LTGRFLAVLSAVLGAILFAADVVIITDGGSSRGASVGGSRYPAPKPYRKKVKPKKKAASKRKKVAAKKKPSGWKFGSW